MNWPLCRDPNMSLPAKTPEIDRLARAKTDAFCLKSFPLGLLRGRALRQGNTPSGVYHPVPGYTRLWGKPPEGPSYASRGTRKSRSLGDVSIGCHLALWNQGHNLPNTFIDVGVHRS